MQAQEEGTFPQNAMHLENCSGYHKINVWYQGDK